MQVFLKEVESRKELMDFIRFPDKLYKNCKYYIPPLHRGQFSTLSVDKNPAFKHCEARYWLAISGKIIVGRIAGIINHRYNTEQKKVIMRFGWLDFVEDEQVARLLIGAVEQWAVEQSISTIQGPLGFNSFDASGVLVEGFDELPTSWGRYNYPYYDKIISRLGYSKDVDWIEQNIKIPQKGTQLREIKIAQMVKARYNLRNADLKSRRELVAYGQQIFALVNEVYNGLYAFSTLSDQEINKLIREFITMIHPDYVSIILNEQDEMIAFGIVLPSLAKALKKAKGKLYPFGILHLLKALKYNDTADMLLIGVKPAYQKKGAYALIFEKIFTNLQAKGYKQVETTRELEDNEKVQQLWEGYEKRLHKRARCYIKSLV